MYRRTTWLSPKHQYTTWTPIHRMRTISCSQLVPGALVLYHRPTQRTALSLCRTYFIDFARPCERCTTTDIHFLAIFSVMRDRARERPASLTRIVSTLDTSSEPLRDNCSSIWLYCSANFRACCRDKNISRRRCRRGQEQRHAPIRKSGNVSSQPVVDAPSP